MEDKTFDLLTKMYGEFTEFRKETSTRLGSLEEGQKGLVNDIIRLENKLDDNSKALFDGYSQNNDRLDRIDEKLDELSDKIDSHDIKIQVIESARR